MKSLFSLSNPARFLRFSRALRLPMTLLAAVLLLTGTWQGLIVSPPDYQQGETVRIMYVHVPSAWLALFIYSTMATAAFIAIVWRHVLADIYAMAAAPLGAGFTLICLVTGALWGKPTWGAWWVWDARLTSVLLLFFLYLGYIALVQSYEDRDRGARAAGFLLLAGFLNIPVIKFSVEWWNTLHQPASVSRMSAPAIDPAMLLPLLLMAGGFFLFYGVLVLMRVETLLARRRMEARQNRLPLSPAAGIRGGGMA